MRPLELWLLLTAFLGLGVMQRTRNPKARAGAAGLGAAILLLHGVFEGVRYQLVPAYFLVAVLGAMALAGLLRPPTAVPPLSSRRAVSASAGILGVVLLVLAALLATMLPVFALPAPTGQDVVGVRYLTVIDESRHEPFVAGSSRPRTLLVKLFYPASPSDGRAPARYFHGSAALLQSMARFYGLPDFAFAHLALVTTDSKEGAALAPGAVPLPAVLLSHGAGASVEMQTSLAEDLASHGYLVAAIDHPYVSAATAFPDRLVTAGEATTDFETPEPAAPISEIMADDARFVLQVLAELNEGKHDPDFTGQVNLDAVAIVGHSVGGAVAYNLASTEPRIKAAVNLDGVVYLVPPDPTGVAPFLMVASEGDQIRSIISRRSLLEITAASTTPDGMSPEPGGAVQEDAIQFARANVAGLAEVLASSETLYTIDGCSHMAFTDVGLFFGTRWLRELALIGGQTEPSRCLEVASAVTVAFCDAHLKRQANADLAALGQTYPELRRIPLDPQHWCIAPWPAAPSWTSVPAGQG